MDGWMRCRLPSLQAFLAHPTQQVLRLKIATKQRAHVHQAMDSKAPGLVGSSALCRSVVFCRTGTLLVGIA